MSLNFRRTDLDLIPTLTDLVESELKLKNREHAIQTLARANKGYRDVSRMFEQRRSWGEEPTNEIKEKLAHLRQELDRLQPLVHPPFQAPQWSPAFGVHRSAPNSSPASPSSLV